MSSDEFDYETTELYRRFHEWYDANIDFDEYLTRIRAEEIAAGDSWWGPVPAAALIAWKTRQRRRDPPWLFAEMDASDRRSPLRFMPPELLGNSLPEDVQPPYDFSTADRRRYYEQYDIQRKYDDPENHDGRTPPDWEERQRATEDFYRGRCARCRREVGHGVEFTLTDHGSDDPAAQKDVSRYIPRHVHHLDPLNARGGNGTHELRNLVLLCIPCHSLMHPDVNSEALGDAWKYSDPLPHSHADDRVAVERKPQNVIEIWFQEYHAPNNADFEPATAGSNVTSQSDKTRDTVASRAKQMPALQMHHVDLWQMGYREGGKELLDRDPREKVSVGETTVNLLSIDGSNVDELPGFERVVDL